MSDITSNLVGLWTLNESPAQDATTIADTSGTGNNGTLTTNDSTTDKSVVGKVGTGAIAFDGTDDQVTLPDMGTVEAYPFTLACWIKHTASGNEMSFLSQSSSLSNTIRVQLYQRIAGTCYYNVRNGGSEADFGAVTLNDGGWHHIAGVSATSTSHKLYVDGAQAGATDTTLVVGILVDKATIAAWYKSTGLASYYAGTMDDVRIYTRALADADISALYDLGSAAAARSYRDQFLALGVT